MRPKPGQVGLGLLERAAEKGNVDIIKLLIPAHNKLFKNACNKSLFRAAESGNLDAVLALIPVSDPKNNHSEALQIAAKNGHVETVKALLPVSDPKASNPSALNQAVQGGHLEIVKLLAPHSDVNSNQSWSLQCAAWNDDQAMISFLIPLSHVDDAIKELILQKDFESADRLSPWVSKNFMDNEISQKDLEQLPHLQAIKAKKTIEKTLHDKVSPQPRARI